jgi:aspartate aminotransferase-like enzyme
MPEGNQRISFLPGPVEISQHVSHAWASLPDSHRGSAFLVRFARTTDALCKLVNSNHVALLLGSGTLANDVVAGQLSLMRERGLILSNGEFGERLTDHAARFGLEFDIYRVPWGQSFDETQLRARLAALPRCRWLWAVHCETSTGVLNDIAMLVHLCQAHGVKICLDCISSIGTLPLDLSVTTFATGVSGKGIAAYPGLSMVFFNHNLPWPSKRLPRYLDLGTYAQSPGVAFTHSSNLVAALEAALENLDNDVATERVSELSFGLREELYRHGFRLIAAPQAAAPAVLTLVPPQGFDAQTLGEQLEEAGFLVAFRSAYLTCRNWMQVCLMGNVEKRHVRALLNAVDSLLSERGRLLTKAERTETLVRPVGVSPDASVSRQQTPTKTAVQKQLAPHGSSLPRQPRPLPLVDEIQQDPARNEERQDDKDRGAGAARCESGRAHEQRSENGREFSEHVV